MTRLEVAAYNWFIRYDNTTVKNDIVELLYNAPKGYQIHDVEALAENKNVSMTEMFESIEKLTKADILNIFSDENDKYKVSYRGYYLEDSMAQHTYDNCPPKLKVIVGDRYRLRNNIIKDAVRVPKGMDIEHIDKDSYALSFSDEMLPTEEYYRLFNGRYIPVSNPLMEENRRIMAILHSYNWKTIEK